MPWAYDNISEEQFLKSADTGDILLFRATHAGGFITRTLTGSRFDHVAMILKFADDDGQDKDLYLLEATGNLGVCLNKWSAIRGSIGKEEDFYSECTYRKVHFDRHG
jgi:hypothetical protein